MKGLNEKYVESIIKKNQSGVLTARQVSAKLGVTKQYLNRLKKN